MPVYMHRSTSLEGTIVEGVISAASLQGVRDKLKASGLIPLSISAQREPGVSGAAPKASRSALVNFTAELAVLIRAGLPLDRALQILADISEDGNMRAVIGSVLREVREGSSFSEALLARPALFPLFYANMVRAGEAGGTLELALASLGEFLESSQEIREHTATAMIYPLILALTGGLSIIVLLAFVVPRFSALLAELGGSLPWSTRLLLDLSLFLQSWWWLMPAAGAAAWLGSKAVLRSPGGRLKWDALKLRVMGGLLTELETARFCRTLGTLLASGVPLLQALGNARDVIGNRLIAQGVERIAAGAKQGRGIGAPLEEAGLFPALAISMIKVGEQSGRLDEMLLRVADTFERRLKRSLKRMIGLIEPVMILAMGLVIGFIVVSLLIAVLSITEMPF